MAILRKVVIGFLLGLPLKGFTQGEQLRSEKWGKGAGMMNVESVVFDTKNNNLYVSNGENYAPGTKGFISKFNANGELDALKWVDKLSRPTGMAIHNDQLWVVDVDQLKVIDLTIGKVVKSYPEPVEHSALNDVAINPKGEVFVTASFEHAVFKLEGDTLKFWVQDKKRLKWANGIFATDHEVWVGGAWFSAINIDTKEIREIKSNPPIQDIDGLWPDGKVGYILSTVDGSSLWHLDAQGKSTLLEQGGDYFGDLQYVPENTLLYVPRGDHKEKRYYLAVFKLEQP
ncbi:MAG: hypothetical protein AAGB24_04290 [Bacteroidota bacterium]